MRVRSARGEESSENSPYLQGGFENQKSKKIIESGLLKNPGCPGHLLNLCTGMQVIRVCARLAHSAPKLVRGLRRERPREVRGRTVRQRVGSLPPQSVVWPRSLHCSQSVQLLCLLRLRFTTEVKRTVQKVVTHKMKCASSASSPISGEVRAKLNCSLPLGLDKFLSQLQLSDPSRGPRAITGIVLPTTKTPRCIL